ncbi:helix-turn-helix domain-containing protein [Bacteroidales bacterium OttesenSCG-928-C03]|nr:helix-turn-helix domain-containing protein [Bacteroidales bacterium OttesenSCG-928-C03]MDL2326619.1 helix-turn-helix domain-containing protein [Bacteroidales bacterium OttesenSCG-928-A14]
MTDRIKNVQEYFGLTATQFADKIELNRSSLTHIYTGRNQPSLDVARKILQTFPEINSDWLIMGRGEMFQAKSRNSQYDLFSMPIPESNETESDNAVEHTGNENQGSDNLDNSKKVVPKFEQEVISKRKRQTLRESNPSTISSTAAQIFNSRRDKKIVKIVLFFDDNSFREYEREE